MQYSTENYVSSKEYNQHRKNTRKRLTIFVPHAMFDEYAELGLGKSLQGTLLDLLSDFLLNLKLKEEFSKLN